MNNLTIYDCSIIEIEKHQHEKGNISVIENRKSIPFDVKRVFYLYDIPGGEDRGAHAHKECHQFMVAVSGAFDIVLDDGKSKRIVTLNRPYFGLHIPPGIWAGEIGFSSGAVCLVLTSHPYDEGDYIRDYNQFFSYKKGK
ncbi:FdtA/QdtA family cupin domain-containing protein [Proteiniphilum sp.]|uniref:sugar 3,4-ketoisomerase n=1 Tax=Proteiniphilum sp. TaxID=1926877 RepID=UPI003326FEFE